MYLYLVRQCRKTLQTIQTLQNTGSRASRGSKDRKHHGGSAGRKGRKQRGDLTIKERHVDIDRQIREWLGRRQDWAKRLFGVSPEPSPKSQGVQAGAGTAQDVSRPRDFGEVIREALRR